MRQVREDLSAATEVRVGEFLDAYELLVRDWDSFHDDYDQWRRTAGGCDRSEAIQTLGQFTVTFGFVASDARNLPAATVLRPMGELLVEAAEREERALKELRDKWQPFDGNIYQSLDRERSTAGKLRRQVAVGIQELFERFGITSE